MGESVSSRMEVSVSFGRFENDALSWEKWSSFSPNKYLEEVGTLSTPGSVAQKKAYFEAHYKKIAARKAELLEMEDSRHPPCPNEEEDSRISTGEDLVALVNDAIVEQPSSADNSIDLSPLEAEIGLENPIIPETVKDLDGDELLAFEDAVKIEEHSPRKLPESSTKIERNSNGAKKKGISAPIKSSITSMPKSLPGKEKTNRSTIPKSKNDSMANKRANPTSLHMSLSWGPSKSSDTFGMTRKSLIMENMGDKDIVKRAFKSFHNRVNGYPVDEKVSLSKEGSSTVSKSKNSTFTPQKGNKGQINATKKVVNPRNKSSNEMNSFSSSSHKSRGIDRKISPFNGVKSDEKAEKRTEKFTRNLEAKPVSRRADSITKSKEEKESDMRKSRQTLNFKATPLPSFYRSRGKGRSEKEPPSNKTASHQSGATNS